MACNIIDVLKNNPDVYLKRKIGDHMVKVMFWNADNWIVIKKWRQTLPVRMCCDDLEAALNKFLE